MPSADEIRKLDVPTRLPLPAFYRELLNTQRVLYSKHLNWRTAPGLISEASRLMLRGQFNFVRGMMLYPQTYNIDKMLRDHEQPQVARQLACEHHLLLVPAGQG